MTLRGLNQQGIVFGIFATLFVVFAVFLPGFAATQNMLTLLQNVAVLGILGLAMDNLPGYPDNINLASDGNYWLALVGMRSPALDLAWRMPGFRKRMGKRLPVDEWLFPNINTGCVVKFNEKGEILESLWDLAGVNHPMITSMREHRGHLYLGGISNNRIGRYKLENADPNFVQYDRRWGKLS